MSLILHARPDRLPARAIRITHTFGLGGFLALHRKCTHLGCSVPWKEDERRFACPCHASAFDIHGDVVNAPAPRPLDLFAVTIRDGVVRVDTTRPIRRTAFEPGQVVRA